MARKSLRLAWVLFALVSLSAACGSSNTAVLAYVGSYNVTVTRDARVDPDVLTVSKGAGDSLLLSFATGIWPTDASPSPLGLRATLANAMLTVASQPARVEYSSGKVDGNISGSGTLPTAGGHIELTLTMAPSSFPLHDADGGIIRGSGSDGGVATLVYAISGDQQ